MRRSLAQYKGDNVTDFGAGRSVIVWAAEQLQTCDYYDPSAGGNFLVAKTLALCELGRISRAQTMKELRAVCAMASPEDSPPPKSSLSAPTPH